MTRWELYHTDVDRSELARPRAGSSRRRLRELVNLWSRRRVATNGFPLDDRSPLEILFDAPVRSLRPVRARDTSTTRTSRRFLRPSRLNMHNRSFTIGALVDIPTPGAQGVLFAQGSRFGGHALYIKENRLHYVNSFVGMFEQQVVATEDVRPVTNLILSASFEKDGEDPPNVATGVMSSTTATRRWVRAGSRPSPAASA